MRIQTEPFRKVADTRAADICQRVELSAEGRAFLVPALSPQGFLALLVEAEQIGDAVRFLAFALPIREGVWWACVTTRAAIVEPTPIEAQCLERAAAWVYDPSDERRRACMDAAEAAKFEGAAAYAALAVFWSGGSIAPIGMPDVVPDPKLGFIGVGASILLAITSGDPKSLNKRFEVAMTRGIDIANGGNGRIEGDRPIVAAK